MSKPPYLLALCTLLGPASVASAYAQDAYLPQPPDMPAYMAYEVRPSAGERIQGSLAFLQGWYITFYPSYSFIQVSDIENVSNAGPGNPVPPTAKSSFSENKFTPGVSIGYQLRQSGFLSRIEVNYMARLNLKYNASPFLIFDPSINSQLNSTIDNHALLLKIYNDFDFGYALSPYVEVGAGVALNSVDGNASIQLLPNDSLQGSADDTTTQFAWDVGAGLRYKLAPQLWFSLGYEFDALGKATWDINFPDDLDPTTPITVKLESGNIYSNTILIGITWQPLPKNY